MSDRRFTHKPELNPEAVRSLAPEHPALHENRTLFPSTVVTVDDSFADRLLVSGVNNRKLGETVTKGRLKGYKLYGLSLEERATCPADCSARAFCYGNGMQLARRHRIADLDYFSLVLDDEIRTILADPVEGLLVRLHVLGDFPSVDYVALWADLLEAYPKLACYGYTHRLTTAWRGSDIGDAIQSVKDRFPDRFRIRWSTDVARPDSAMVVDFIPRQPRIDQGLVCPAQTDATACCATCGLCWDATKDGIVFIKHGPKSDEAEAEVRRGRPEKVPASVALLPAPEGPLPAPPPTSEAVRAVEKIPVAGKRDDITDKPPTMRMVKPTELRVELAYQRDLSGKSLRLIRKIVSGWDWAKFKPPVCAETADGLFVIDGQHTAIAAASHPFIKEIPVMIVAAAKVEKRAAAFVAHNRDRLAMTPAQVFYGEVAAGDKDARAMLLMIMKAGGSLPRLQVQKGYAKPGQITAVGHMRRMYRSHPNLFERIVRICVMSKAAPISATVLSGVHILLSQTKFTREASAGDETIATALAKIKNIETAAQAYGLESGQDRFRACAVLLANGVSAAMKEAA